MSAKNIFSLLKQSGSRWVEDQAPTLGAALAYYTAFSLAPLMIILIAVAGLVFGREAAQARVFQQTHGLLGDQGGKAVEMMVRSSNKPAQGIAAAAIGVISLLFGASSVFGQLQISLNMIWQVTPKPGRGFWGMIKDRILSFGMILSLGFLLLVSLILSAALAAMGKWMGNAVPTIQVIAQAGDFLVSFAVITLLFALIFKYLPDVRIAWRDVWPGAGITALLFTVGKYGLGLYLGKSGIASSYGAAGSLLALLIWVFYSAQILFFGAEFTWVYANRVGCGIAPGKDAVAVPNKLGGGAAPREPAMTAVTNEQEAEFTPGRLK